MPEWLTGWSQVPLDIKSAWVRIPLYAIGSIAQLVERAAVNR
jgi:hypothetical protein